MKKLVVVSMIILICDICFYSQNAFAQLDSTISVSFRYFSDIDTLSHKTIYSYNQQSQKVLEKNYSWKMNSDTWQINSKTEFEYDEFGNINKETEYSRSANDSIWYGSSKLEHEFNIHGDTLMRASYQWDNLRNDWEGFTKQEYGLNDDRDTIMYSFYDWDEENFEWNGRNRLEYDFDENKNLILEIRSITDSSNTWYYFSKEVKEYNENSSITFSAKYRWDKETGNWFTNGTKSEFTYNADGKILQLLTSLGSNGQNAEWSFSGKTDYYYDETGRLLSESEFRWNTDSVDWIGTMKEEYSYLDEDNTISFIEYSWNSDEGYWKPFNRSDSLFNDSGMILSVTSYGWNNTLKEWYTWQKLEFSYNDQGNEESVFIYSSSFTTEDWTNDAKYLMQYENGFLVLSEKMVWILKTETWINDEKWEYAYDEYNNLILDAHWEWDAKDSLWQGVVKYEFAYDEYGNQVLRAKYLDHYRDDIIWKGDGDRWMFRFDEKGRMTMKARYTWYTTEERWRGQFKEEYEYNEQDQYITIRRYRQGYENSWPQNGAHKTQFYYDFSGNLLLIEGYEGVDTFWQWDLTSRKYYYYPETGLFTKNQTEQEIAIFPNPFSHHVTISTERNSDMQSIRIFDLQGKIKKEFSSMESSSLTISREGLNAGIYLVIIELSTHKEVRKLILK